MVVVPAATEWSQRQQQRCGRVAKQAKALQEVLVPRYIPVMKSLQLPSYIKDTADLMNGNIMVKSLMWLLYGLKTGTSLS